MGEKRIRGASSGKRRESRKGKTKQEAKPASFQNVETVGWEPALFISLC